MTMMGVHGQGSITKRKTGPPYQVALTIAGRRVYRYAHTEREAEERRKELIRLRDLDLDPSRQTVADFLRSWIAGLRDARNQRVRPRTLEHYTLIVERHIIPGLGHHRLPRLREHHVQHWLDQDAGAPRTVHHHRAVLRRALNVAVRRRYIDRNPALAVDLPDASWNGAKPLNLDEAKRLLEATKGDRLHALWRLALDTGLRQSEILGLGWDDVDLDAGVVAVTSQLQRIGGAWVRTPTKADRALGVLALDAATVDALRDHQRRMAAERTPEWAYFGLVFPTRRGQPHVNNVILREWRAACDKAGIPRRRFHDLRHSTDTILEELGIAENVRMARLGHVTTRMARRYTKASGRRDREAAEALGRALAG